jgi:hypothetical protein
MRLDGFGAAPVRVRPVLPEIRKVVHSQFFRAARERRAVDMPSWWSLQFIDAFREVR